MGVGVGFVPLLVLWLLLCRLLDLLGAGLDHELHPHELLLDEADDGGEMVGALDGVDVINPLMQEFLEELVLDVGGQHLNQSREECIAA